MKSSGIHFQNEKFTLIHDDVLTTTRVENESVDLVITSPPYNVDIQYNSHKDDVSYADYLEFSNKWMARCYEWLKDEGRFCLNIPLDKNKGGQQSVGADLTTLAKQVGFHYHSTIIWNEGNISRRTAWGSWKSASAPYVIAPVELIVVLYKAKWKKTSGSKVSDIERDEFLDWTNGLWVLDDENKSSDITPNEITEWTNRMWVFNGESKKRIGHPAPFPIELPRRCIKLFSYVDDVVLDPFCGSGTTIIAAVNNNRKGIGIDVDKKYCELARKRILGITPEAKPKTPKKK